MLAGRSAEERQRLLEWYNTVKERPYRLRTQLSTYCQEDVAVLRMAMTRFSAFFKRIFNFCPWQHNATLASSVMRAFQLHYMPPNSLPIMDERGHRRTSLEACEFIAFAQHVIGNLRWQSPTLDRRPKP